MADARVGRALLAALKASVGPGDATLTLPVGRPSRASLRPVATRQGSLDAADVARLTDWRNRFVTAFLTEFQATAERTGAWLCETVGPDDTRILFMVDDAEGQTVGYMGLAAIDWEHGTFEVDAVVRGVEAPRGLMSAALRTLIRWAYEQLGLRDARVRVMADNGAQEFYKKLGFVEVGRVPLRRLADQEMVRWVEDADATDASRAVIHLAWAGR